MQLYNLRASIGGRKRKIRKTRRRKKTTKRRKIKKTRRTKK